MTDRAGTPSSPPLVLDYHARMMDSPQFELFGIEPKWQPGTGDIDGFCHDEVVRQFHNTTEPDGEQRVRWMRTAWDFAREQAYPDRLPTIEDVLGIARRVEPQANAHGFRQGWVRVGGYIAPDPVNVPRLVADLWEFIDSVALRQGKGGPAHITADDFYLEFEHIHPFIDGNGRTGKILHNWLLGTLDEPVLVADYFGGGNP